MHDFSTGRSGYDRVLAAVAATFLLTGTVTPAALRQAAVELQNGVLRTQ